MADGFMRMLTSCLHNLKENIVVSCSLLNVSLSSLSTSIPSATSPLLPLPQLLVPAIPTLRFQEVTFVDSTRNGICPPVVKAGCSSLKSLSGPAPFSSVAVSQVRCSCWQPPSHRFSPLLSLWLYPPGPYHTRVAPPGWKGRPCIRLLMHDLQWALLHIGTRLLCLIQYLIVRSLRGREMQDYWLIFLLTA